MASAGIAQPNENTVHHPNFDSKGPIAVEVPVGDWPQQVTDILSPDLITAETDSVARQLGHEDGVLDTEMSLDSMIVPPTAIDAALPDNIQADPKTPLVPRVEADAAHPDNNEADPIPPSTLPAEMNAEFPETSETDLSTSSADSISSTPKNSLPSTPDTVCSDTSAALNSDNDITLSERPSTKLALQILDVIQRYGHDARAGVGVEWLGKRKFLPLVEHSIENKAPIKMVLPAFPCKSTNKVDKVLGNLPDLGEELALMHLNALCENIAEIYEYGAQVVITSDGLVYNDILGIPDIDVWDYSTAVRDIIKVKELRHISTLRIVDLLGHSRTEELTREEYLAHAGCYRRELTARFAPKNLDTRAAIRSEADTCMTYTGYVKFLLKDLKHSALAKDSQGQKLSGEKYKRAVKNVALAMIERGKTFAAAIEANCRDHVRLSIHPSTGQTKLSIPLIPQPGKGNLMTPWHCAIAVGLDGSFRTVHAADVRDTYDIIYQNGHPHHLREKSELWDFGAVKVEFEHLYPCGLVIRPAAGPGSASLRDVEVVKVRKFAELQSPVVLRGFADTTNQELYIEKAGEMGEILPWMFGKLMVVKDQRKADRGSNNVASNEAMPMHYDGIFKFRTKKDENGNVMKDEEGNELQVQIPPRFQMFSAAATAPKGSGYTLFAESRLFFQHLPAPYTLERLQAVRWRLLSIGYWHGKMRNMSLVVPHPVTGVPCLRWHENWPESKTKYSTGLVQIENDEQQIVDMVDRLLYDRRVCLRFGWERGDILIADNSSMMHTRTAFKDDCERELWRIHLDEMQVNLCNEE